MVIEKDDKLILLTNDDGLYAGGLKTLLEVVEEFGKVVLISTTESNNLVISTVDGQPLICSWTI